MTPSRLWLAALLLIVTFAPASADEGMWTFNNFPADKVEQAYGFRPDQAWLDHVRLSSVRLAGGCSASLRVAERPGADQPPLRARAASSTSRPRTSDYVATASMRAKTTDESQVPGHGDQPARRDHRRHRARQQGDGAARTARPSTRRRRPSRPHIDKECAGNDATTCAATWSRSITAASTTSTSTAATRTCGWCSRPRMRSRSSAATRTISTSRATTSTSAFCASTQDGKPLDTSRTTCATPRPTRRPGDLDLRVRPSRRDRPPRYGRAARVPARRRAAARDLRCIRSCAACSPSSHRGPEQARIAGACCSASRTAQGAQGPVRGAASTRRSSTTSAPRSRRCAPRSTPIRAAGAVRRGLGQDREDAGPSLPRAGATAITSPRAAGLSLELFGYRQALVRHAAERQARRASGCREYTDANFPIAEAVAAVDCADLSGAREAAR